MARRPNQTEDALAITQKISDSQYRKGQVGDVPGTFKVDENAKFPDIYTYTYNEKECLEQKFASLEDLFKHVEAHTKHTIWINIEGHGNSKFLNQLQAYFGLHNLTLEDVTYMNQRPKVEDYDTHLFIISRMLYFYENKLIDEQIAFFVFDNVLITIQEELEDCLEPVRERISKGRGTIRQRNAYYLTYALIDAIIDNFFPMIERLHERMEKLEAEIMLNPEQHHLNEITQTKKEIIQIRKAILAERDKIAVLQRSDFVTKDDKLELFLRDAYDHCIQIVELIEGEKEIAYSLMDVYMSTVSNKTNDVMKFLTILSAIFIPLTFIVGIYGMNFAERDHNGKLLPMNMPELYSPYGYAITWGVMLSIVIGLVVVFKRRKWF